MWHHIHIWVFILLFPPLFLFSPWGVCVSANPYTQHACVYACPTVCVRGWGRSWPRLFFSAHALGSPPSSCDWCAPVADHAEARAQGPAEADVYLWSDPASVRGPWSSNILILTNTALGLIFSSGRTHQLCFCYWLLCSDLNLCLFYFSLVSEIVKHTYKKASKINTAIMMFAFYEKSMSSIFSTS